MHACVRACVHAWAFHLLAFAATALDEEANEVEQRRVFVRLIGLNPIINHRLLRHDSKVN